MKSNNRWEAEYEKELEHGRLARLEGNEGMARVCARRAAGIVIGEYLHRRGYAGVNNSAYDRISLFLELPDVDEATRDISRHFLVKVNPDRQLPVNADLLQDVTRLKAHLFKDNR